MAIFTSAERTIGELRALASYAAEDLDRTFPIRIFKWGRQVSYEPALEPMVAALNKVLGKHPHVPELIKDFDRAYARALACTSDSRTALKVLEAQRSEWQAFKRSYPKTVGKDNVRELEDFLAWVDRDVEERVAIARAASRREAAGDLREIVKAGKKLDGGKVYAQLLAGLKGADAETREALLQVARYCKRDDPVWERIAEKLAKVGPKAPAEDLEAALQGILGEALALRNPWVVERLATAVDRAQELVRGLGKEWKVVVAELPTRASTRSGGMGEIYDASVWIVRETPDGVREAAPVWVLQVKSGKVGEAAEQVSNDVMREFGPKVRIPVAGPSPGEQEYAIRNLREVLEPKGKVAAGSPTFGEASTQRVLVAPRPPSERSVVGKLKPGVSIEYVEAVMGKRKLNRCSRALAKALRP
jgi:hypothetical protein